MIAAKIVGTVLGDAFEKRFFGSKEAAETFHRTLFKLRLARALLSTKKTNGKKEAERIAEDVRVEVPVDTGQLRDSIRVVESKRGAKVIAGGTPETMKPFPKGGGVFDQALGIEYGTSKRPAQPYYWPVMRKNEKHIERSLAKAIEDEVG